MQEKAVLFFVGSQCTPEQEEKFNKWYNETHIPMLLKARGMVGATRYKLAPIIEGEYPTYLAIYEFEDRQAFEEFWSGSVLVAAREEMKETWGDKPFDIKWRVVYEPIKTWHK